MVCGDIAAGGGMDCGKWHRQCGRYERQKVCGDTEIMSQRCDVKGVVGHTGVLGISMLL